MTATSSNRHSGVQRRHQVPWTSLAARAAAAVVAAVAGAASFEHIASVAIGAGERSWVSYSLPFAIDGLIVVGVAALLEDQRHHRHGRMSARLAVLVGVVATLAANVASADPTATARLVALAAPVSFLLSVEVLTRTGRKLSAPAATTTGDHQAGKPATGGNPKTMAVGPRQPTTPATPERRSNTAQRVANAVANNPTANAAEIAARLKVSERTVLRYWPDPSPPASGNHSNSGQPAAARQGLAPVPASAFAPPNANPTANQARAAR